MSVQTSKDGWELSNKAMKITSLLTSGKGQSKSSTSGTTNSKRNQLVYSSDQHSVIHLPPARYCFLFCSLLLYYLIMYRKKPCYLP